jgi:putative flippase GtrA
MTPAMTIRSRRERLRHMLGHAELRRFGLFLLVGGLNTLFGYAMFSLLLSLGAELAGATLGATVLGVLFNFKSIGRLVFRDGNGRLFPRFVAVYVVQAGINYLLLHVAARNGIAPLLAEALILPLLAVATFLAMRRFVFAAVPEKIRPES